MTLFESGVSIRAEELADELHGYLSDGRSNLAKDRLANGQVITVRDEKMWARPAMREWLDERQARAYSAGSPYLPEELDYAQTEAWDVSFKGGRLIREWMEVHSDKTNMWAKAGESARYECADGSIVYGLPVARDSADLERQLRRMIGVGGVAEVEWDINNPELELILPDADDARLTAFKHVGKETFVTMRRPTFHKVAFEQLVANGTMSALAASFISAVPRAGLRVLVSGSMNTGKTVLLRAICQAQPKDWQLFTIESQGELLLDKFPDFYPRNVYAMEARKKNAQGGGEITMASLIERCQRASPDLVVVGEVREAASAAAFLRGLGQGYPIIGTIHATSALDSIHNLALYYSEGTDTDMGTALQWAGKTIDVAIHMRQLPTGQRVLNSITLVEGTLMGANLTAEELWVPQSNGPARLDSGLTVIPAGIMDQLVQAGFDPSVSDAVEVRA